MDVKGCVAVVSGGASGMGEHSCRLLAESGAKVSILDLQEDRGERLASELGEMALFCRTDVTDPESVQAAVEKTVEKFGTVNVAVNCAGVPSASKILTKKGPIPMEGFNKVVQINLMGSMHIIRSAVEQMAKNTPNQDGERGVIINTSSGAAFEGQIGQAAYSASKAALEGMTLQLARELAEHGIRVMTIAPGLFETPMVAGLPDKVKEALIEKTVFPKRMAKPIEFAMLARHIIKNPMLNGRTIRLDGAFTMTAR